MEGDGLICNYKKCRKRLTDIAYVTACSHVFCDEDGTREFKKSMTCPACQTNLSNKFEIVRNNLQPSEQYKAMILAGMRPDMINDISSRALTFWEYQSHQEKTYLHFMVNKSKERSAQIEQNYEKFLSQTTAEINTSKKETEEIKKKNNEITDRLMDRNRQLQKLQTMYDSLRRKFITASSFETHKEYSPVPSFIHKALSPERHTATGASGDNGYVSSFDFNPRLGCNEMVHHDVTHGDNTVQKKFSVGLSTPRQ